MCGRGGAPSAIDRRLIGRFDGDDIGHPVCPAWRNGADRSGAHAAAQAVAEPVNAVPGCVGAARGSPGAGFVRRFVRTLRDYKVRAHPVLPGRGSCSVDVTSAPSASGDRCLMPAARNAGLRRAIGEHRHGLRRASSWYVVRNTAGRHGRFVLITRPAAGPDGDDGKGGARRITGGYTTFATSLPFGRARPGMPMLPGAYRQRRGTGTACRQIGAAGPRATGRSGAFRMIPFPASPFTYDMRAAEHAGSGTNPGEAMPRALAYSAAMMAARSIIERPFDQAVRVRGVHFRLLVLHKTINLRRAGRGRDTRTCDPGGHGPVCNGVGRARLKLQAVCRTDALKRGYRDVSGRYR